MIDSKWEALWTSLIVFFFVMSTLDTKSSKMLLLTTFLLVMLHKITKRTPFPISASRWKAPPTWARLCGNPAPSAYGIVLAGRTCWTAALLSTTRTARPTTSTWPWAPLSRSFTSSCYEVC